MHPLLAYTYRALGLLVCQAELQRSMASFPGSLGEYLRRQYSVTPVVAAARVTTAPSRSPTMMGRKARLFPSLPAVSLEELVPADHFYRHLERVLDLSLVRDLVQECYASCGRPSIDPVVFFKLQLVMFFEDVRSERLLMRLVADRLSERWFLGYNLDEPLPDHSSLTPIRARYGLEVFRRFFTLIFNYAH